MITHRISHNIILYRVLASLGKMYPICHVVLHYICAPSCTHNHVKRLVSIRHIFRHFFYVCLLSCRAVWEICLANRCRLLGSHLPTLGHRRPVTLIMRLIGQHMPSQQHATLACMCLHLAVGGRSVLVAVA